MNAPNTSTSQPPHPDQHLKPTLNLKPVLKWSGGKRQEIPILEPLFPTGIQRVIEPFAGGAAVSLHLNAPKSVLNDVSKDLIRLYSALKQPKHFNAFVTALQMIDKRRKALHTWAHQLSHSELRQIFPCLEGYALPGEDTTDPKKNTPPAKRTTKQSVETNTQKKNKKNERPLCSLLKTTIADSVIGMPPDWHDLLVRELTHSCQDKIYTRLPALQKKHGPKFDYGIMRDHLDTALQAGLYNALRWISNGKSPTIQTSGVHLLSTQDKKPQIDLTSDTIPQNAHQRKTKITQDPCDEDLSDEGWRVAAWYVVRALCYSGMFRYNEKGEMNVPYGGIGYNDRNFETSIIALKDPLMRHFWTHVELHRGDFEDILGQAFEPHDFIFVDPPYDTSFSQYNADTDFTQDDQKRLAQCLQKIKSPWMVVIKDTDFIFSLYHTLGCSIGIFDKHYQVNFRNRHDRGVQHLVITNYPLVFNDHIRDARIEKAKSEKSNT